jgi:hypothetical protein
MPITNYNGIQREMTEQEIAEYEATVEANQTDKAAQDAARAAKAAARQAVLDKLGLTADEAAALLG